MDDEPVTSLTLICHASTAATRAAAFPADEPIELRGAEKAAALRASLRRTDRAWTSPALRARQTAAALGLPAVVDAGLRECDYGRWSGRTLSEVQDEEPESIAAWIGDPGAAPHGGESVLDLLSRTGAWLDAHATDSGHAIAVTHASVVRAAVVHAIAATPASFWRIDAAPLSRTVLSQSGGLWRLQAMMVRDD